MGDGREAADVPAPAAADEWPWLAPTRVVPLLLAAAAALSWWYAGRGLPFQDEGAILTAAAKILRGGVFYRDIDMYPFPGAAYLLAGCMALFGEHLSVARALAGIAFCTWVGALYAIALRLLDPPRAALFGASLLAFKFLGWPGFTVYIYADVAFAAGCVAMALLVAGAPGTRRLVGAGVCVAAAVASKQSLGLYLGAACVLILLPVRLPFRLGAATTWRPLFVFVASAAVPLLAGAAWFASHGLLPRLLYSGLVRPLTGYLPTSGMPFAPMLAWWRLGSLDDPTAGNYFPTDYVQAIALGALGSAEEAWWLVGEVFVRLVYTAAVVAVAWLGVRIVREARAPAPDARDASLLAFGVLAVAVFGSAFPRADFFHVISVFPPLWLLLLALIHAWRPPRRAPVAAAAVLAFFLVGIGVVSVLHRSIFTHRVTLARADVVVPREDAWIGALVDAIETEIDEGAPLFVYGHESHLYFLAGRFSPWPFSQLYPGQTGQARGAQIAALLERAPPRWIVWGRQFWPGMPRMVEYAPRLEQWIRTRYRLEPGLFGRYPPPPGVPAPRPQDLSVLRRIDDQPGVSPSRSRSAVPRGTIRTNRS